MRKALILTAALVATTSPLSAQTARWNDRPSVTWQDEAPRVRVWIDGARSVSYGAPMRVRFEVSDNAYVTVVRVDDQGRMTILFPYSRNQRATARANFVHDVRNPRLAGQAAFYATDRMGGGYVFALASYAPLDLSTFENRDYDRIGGWSQYTRANRDFARRPDVFVDRFAAKVLWDVNTPYDYDVDYYFPAGVYTNSLNTLAMCSALYDQFGAHTFGSAFYYDFDNIGFVSMPYRSMCRSYYQQARCMWYGYSYAACNMGTIVATVPGDSLNGKPVEDPTGTESQTPNEGVIRGGLFAPTPLPVPLNSGGGDPVPAERPIGRFDRPIATDLDDIKSIPTRATRKMKEDDAKREAIGAPARAGSGFARTEASNKPDKSSVANSDAPQRVSPPSRQPTKSKNVGETRDSRPKGGYGTNSRPSEPRYNGPDRTSRTVDKSSGSSGGSTGGGGSIQSAPTGDKKKPPQNE